MPRLKDRDHLNRVGSLRLTAKQARERTKQRELARIRFHKAGKVSASDNSFDEIAWLSWLKRPLDWSVLLVGLLGLVTLTMYGLFHIEGLGGIYFDPNFIVVMLITWYSSATGLKQYIEGKRRVGLYMVGFSMLMTLIVILFYRIGVFVLFYN